MTSFHKYLNLKYPMFIVSTSYSLNSLFPCLSSTSMTSLSSSLSLLLSYSSLIYNWSQYCDCGYLINIPLVTKLRQWFLINIPLVTILFLKVIVEVGVIFWMHLYSYLKDILVGMLLSLLLTVIIYCQLSHFIIINLFSYFKHFHGVQHLQNISNL